MPELPQVQALAERLDARLAGRAVTAVEPIGVAGLKTVEPPVEAIVGTRVAGVARRAKYLLVELGDHRVVVHLSRAGRVDLEDPAKRTRPRGAVVRLGFDDGAAVLVREHGTERKAAWWILPAGEDGPLAGLGPEPGTAEFVAALTDPDDRRRVHTVLRDQRTVAGIGRGYADDICHRAGCSPFATIGTLDGASRARLLAAIDAVLAEALERERHRDGGLSAPRLGEHFTVHGKAGMPCPVCGTELARVSYRSAEVVYCPRCQTGGRVLADRRRSRLIR